MPIKKKKISELGEAKDLTGFFTIGYRVINGVKESVKYGLQKIQDLYEDLVKAISNAGEATTDATTAANSAYASAEAADAAAEAATEVAEHPTYIGTDNYVYVWNTVTKAYDKANIYVKGEAFNISKVYASVEALEADVGNTGIKEGAFVLVNTNDVENPDNAKLYVKVKNPDDSYRYQFLVDMSGAIGFTGKTPQFVTGNITTGEAGTDVQLSLSESGTDPDGNPVVALNLVIPRGNPGVPFKILGHYDTLDELKSAVSDGSVMSGCYAVGTLPYTYYAWYNGDWQDQGRLQGNDGKSAYQVACENGFVGSEAAWLASLKEFDELEVKGGIHSKEGYFHADKGWFQCSTKGAGLSNAATDSRFYSPEVRVWESDSNIRVAEGMSYQLGGGTTKLSLGSLGSVNIATEHGSVDIGPMNEDYCHFQTEKPQFYMSKPLRVDGEIYSGTGYSNLVLNTQNSANYWAMCKTIPGRYHELDLSGLDESLYYPCTCYVDCSALTRIQIASVLTNKSHPSWGTNDAGFSFDLMLEVNGPSYGAILGYSRILKAEYSWATGTPCGGYVVTFQSNQFIVWLRGGGIYDVYKDDTFPMSIHGVYNDGYNSYGTYDVEHATARWGNIWTSGAGLLGVGSLIASGYITAVGEITANSTSDARLKKDIEDLPEEDATEIIMNARPVTYCWNDKAFELNPYRSKERECGLIAQELEPYLPCAIKPVWEEYKAIDYTRLIAPMLSVMKKQEREIEALKKEVQQLKKEV